jgi:GxxExxY protein
MLSKIPSRLPDELEGLIHRTIGCCVEVHRQLGPGLLEGIYARAISLELAARDLRFDAQRPIPVYYREELLCHQRLDIVVEDQVLLEVKSVDRLHPVHTAQIVCYLRVSRLRVGLLMNFNVPVLQEGLRRIVL